MMVYALRESQQFVTDLKNLDPVIRKRANKSVKQLENDPYYPGLDSHSQESIHNRKAMRSRVNDNFRILWEWDGGGVINLWRVAKHDVIDAMDSLPTEAGANWRFIRRNDVDGSSVLRHDWRNDLRQPQPFRNVPENHLRLFGVPDERLGEIRALYDPEELWDMPLDENVQYTLYDVLTKAEDWTADSLLDTSQLLYRATADQLEGYCEGKIKRLLLNLNEEQEKYVTIDAGGPVLIKGVAGSGKTTIGLYRANYLARQIEERRRLFGEDTMILLITYTKTLTKALEQLYEEKYGEMPASITIAAFKEWMRELLNSREHRPAEATFKQRENLIEEALAEVLSASPDNRAIRKLSTRYLLDEIDTVIRARGLYSLAAYQAVSRVGRGAGLDRERQRPLVWRVYERYQAELDARKLFDWADLARLVMKHCQPLPQFDVLIIDEAQDMPPCDLRLMTRLIPDYRELRSLTLLADPAQSIYYRGIPWKEGGVEIRGGRTQVLAKNYRNTHEILVAARSLAERSKTLEAANEYIPPTSTDKHGPKPQVIQYENIEDCEAFVVEEIVKLCQTGNYRPGDIAIAARMQNLLSRYMKGLSKAQINCVYFRNDDFHILENEVKLITMPSAKGLEFPVMFLVGLGSRFLPWIRSKETQAEDEESDRKLLYVGMTRASERLYLLHPKYYRSPFLHELDMGKVRKRIIWLAPPTSHTPHAASRG